MTGSSEDRIPSSRPAPAEAEQNVPPRPEDLPDGGLKEADARVAPLADELQAHA